VVVVNLHTVIGNTMKKFLIKSFVIFLGLTVVSSVSASQKRLLSTGHDLSTGYGSTDGDDSDLSVYSVRGSAIDVHVIESKQEQSDVKSCMKDFKAPVTVDQKKMGGINNTVDSFLKS